MKTRKTRLALASGAAAIAFSGAGLVTGGSDPAEAAIWVCDWNQRSYWAGYYSGVNIWISTGEAC